MQVPSCLKVMFCPVSHTERFHKCETSDFIRVSKWRHKPHVYSSALWTEWRTLKCWNAYVIKQSVAPVTGSPESLTSGLTGRSCDLHTSILSTLLMEAGFRYFVIHRFWAVYWRETSHGATLLQISCGLAWNRSWVSAVRGRHRSPLGRVSVVFMQEFRVTDK
jgi:hypothetical protein